jgi:hypothetical protein
VLGSWAGRLGAWDDRPTASTFFPLGLSMQRFSQARTYESYHKSRRDVALRRAAEVVLVGRLCLM